MKKNKLKLIRATITGIVIISNVIPVYAANDPISVVNNLSNFIFGLIKVIGMILTGFGILQFGLALKSHDPSQRSNGILSIAGGIIVTFTKEILNIIAG